MFSLSKPYRPDPFRFRRPVVRRHFNLYFHGLNHYLFRCRFSLLRRHISPADLGKLRRIRPGKSLMIVTNHVNFMDPHVMFELAAKARFEPRWMAGIEPFDFGRGVFGWHLQSVGVFSIDRGVLDRPALERAQVFLDEGRYPLVIYPEGEAAYTNKTLQTFYPGAAMFALNAVEKHLDDTQPVEILPVGIRYQFMQPATAQLKTAIQSLHQDIVQAAETEGLAMTTHPIPLEEPLWQQITQLVHWGLLYLEHIAIGYQADLTVPLQTRLLALRDFLVKQICNEHLPQQQLSDEVSTDDLMLLKNKLRTIIARKRHAPPLALLLPVIQQVEGYLNSAEQGHLSRQVLKQLSRLENQWIGQTYPKKDPLKRLKGLLKHLRQQEPYSKAFEAATPEDLHRWEQQIQDTRRVKLLTLLVDDLAHQDDSDEGLDETLMKLEILLFGKFIYRGPKEAFVKVGKLMDVKAFYGSTLSLTQKERAALLTEKLQERVAALININLDMNQRNLLIQQKVF